MTLFTYTCRKKNAGRPGAAALLAACFCLLGGISCGVESVPRAPQTQAQVPQTQAPPDTCLCVAGASRTKARAKDDTTFFRRCEQLARVYPAETAVAATGRQLLALWEESTRRTGAAPLTLVFAHGDEYGLFFRPDEGFYRDAVLRDPRLRRKYGGGARMAKVSELRRAVQAGRIAFSPEKPVALLSCNSRPLAEDLAELGAAVLCADGYAGPLNRADSTGETGYFFAEQGFWFYSPGGGKADSLGKLLAPALWLERQRAGDENTEVRTASTIH